MIYWLKSNRDMGPLLLRIFIGTRLLYGVVDNIASWEKMQEFASFLKTYDFPFPIFSAIVSVYAQAIAGLLLIIGYKTRWAALTMVVNFLIAFFMVHWGQPYDQLTSVLSMLFISVLFLFTGAGKYSIDRQLSGFGTLHEKKSALYSPAAKKNW
ncbi:MAG: DoxX family protein [Chitinophagaceae bacterium]